MPPGVDTKASIKRAVKALLMRRDSGTAISGTRILTYHSVGPRAHEMNVPPAVFAEQMAWLAENVPILSLPEAVRGEEGVAVTFDDGYADNLYNAVPVLHGVSIPATVFVVAGKLDTILDHDAGDAHARLLNKSELVELRNAGVLIGGHSMTHPRLSRLSSTEQREEIVRCKAILEDILGEDVSAFAYPYGTVRDYCAETVRHVRESGFAIAVTNRYGAVETSCDPFTVRRINIDGTDTLETFAAKVDGRLDALRHLENDLGVYARAALNRLLYTR